MMTESLLRPEIGIMARVRFVDGVFVGQQGALLSHYLQIANKNRLFACVFDPTGVDVETGMVSGYVLTRRDGDATERIAKVNLSVPAVIYDQVLSRKYETARKISAKRQYLRKHAVIFNDGYFNKWQVYEWLSEVQELEEHLPKTSRYSLTRLRDYCSLYPVIFIKPVHGSLGRGIIKLIRQEEGWQAMIRLKHSIKETKFTSDCESIHHHFLPRTERQPYLLQEGVALLEVDHRPLDIRVLMQKNERGEWKSTKTYIRLAAKGEFVSNLSSGGEAFAISWLKDELPSTVYQRMRKQVKNLVKILPDIIEQKAKRTLGEMGLDFGVDQSGQVYLLEINSKPRKNVETTRGTIELVERALERPLLYAMHLYASSHRELRKGV